MRTEKERLKERYFFYDDLVRCSEDMGNLDLFNANFARREQIRREFEAKFPNDKL